MSLDPQTWTDAELRECAGRFPNAIEWARSSISMEVHMAAAAQIEINRRKITPRCALCLGEGIALSPNKDKEFGCILYEECPECS